jgi:tetratricopeptide (TPR) repeat protein
LIRAHLALALAALSSLSAAPLVADPLRGTMEEAPALQLAQAAPSTSDSGTGDSSLADLQYWNAIKDSKKAADYQAYLEKFPNGDFADLAKIRVKQYGGDPAVTPAQPTETTPTVANPTDPRLQELDFWNQVKDSKSPDDYQAYLNKYPNGEFVDLAKLRIQQYAKPADATPTPVPTTTTAPAPSVPAPLPTFEAVSQAVYPKSSGRVRATPDKNGAVLQKVATNTPLNATGKTAENGGWWRVMLPDGRTGYIAASVISPQPVAVQAPPAKATEPAKVTGSDADLCKLSSAAAANDRVAACERVANAAGGDAAKRAALLDLAAALDVAHRFDEAIRKYEQAAALAPNEPSAYAKIGLVRLEQKRFKEARAAFDKAAMLDNKNPDYVFLRGVAAADFGDFAKARDEVKRALLSKEDTRYYEALAGYELALGHLAEAKTAVERGRKIDAAFSSPVTMLVDYFNGNRDGAATAAANAAAANAPEARLWQALVLKAKGDAAGAQQTLEVGRGALGPKDWPAPVYDHLLGKIDKGRMLTLAKARDPIEQAEHLAIANFFAGEWAFLGGDSATARSALQDATNAQAFHLLEHVAAKARLANMIR